MEIRRLFDECATAYDQDRPRLVPRFDDFYGAALQRIPFAADARVYVLDLGAGTGLLAAMVRRMLPSATLHLTDISEAMLERARQRFTGVRAITCAVEDHLQLAAEAEYDLILSALSIHHLGHVEKRALIGKVFRALRPGGAFINADQVLGPTPEAEAEYERQWLADAIANGIAEPALEQARLRMREDKNALLSDQLQWLRDAGFSRVDCSYQRLRFAVYGGTKIE